MSPMRYVVVPRTNTTSLSSLHLLNKKTTYRAALAVLLAIVILLPLASYASATLVVTRRHSPPIVSLSPFWSWNFESGTQWANSGPLPSEAAGNSPGQVVSTIVHSGTHAGYYVVAGSNVPDPSASYPSLDFRAYSSEYPNGVPTITTKDIYAEVWIYVPKVTLVGNGAWVSFWTTETVDWDYAITVDSGNDRKAFIFFNSNANLNGQCFYQTGSGVQWPFDTWFKIGVELHLRPNNQLSTIILYQNDVEIDRTTFQVYAGSTYATQAPQPWMFHWGLYQGGGQTTLTVYNDDIAIYDLT